MPRPIGYKMSEDTKRKIGLSNKRYKPSPEHMARITELSALKSRGNKRPPFSEQWLKNLSESHKGNKASDATKEKMSISHKGQTCWWKGKRGENSANWKGGRVDKIKILRNSDEFKQWRLKVFIRDNFRCRECGEGRRGSIQAHHIVPIRKDLNKIFDVSNGITLCQRCHGKTWWHEDKFEQKYFAILNSKILVSI